MKSNTFRFKKGKIYHVDDTDYILSDFGRCFKNVDEDGNDDDMNDNQICLKSCSVTIRTNTGIPTKENES